MVQPGNKVRGSTTGRPIMALLDLLGRRWVLRILWELREAALGFRALQARCGGMSPSVLSARVTELAASGILDLSAQGDYQLTHEGRKLIEALQPLHGWAERWAKRTSRAQG